MWAYNFLSGVARNSETGQELRVERLMPDDFINASAMDGGPHGLEPSSFEALRGLCVSERNRFELQSLIHALFQNDFSKAVVTLCKAEGRKASVRTLQAWLMPPDRQSSRRCPTWAVTYLKSYRDTHADEIRTSREFKESQSEYKGQSRVDRVYNGNALMEVERQLAYEDRYRQELRSSSIAALPDLLADKLLKIESNYERLLSNYFALLRCIRSAESLEDLKAKFSEEEDDINRSESFLASARRAVLSNSDEFESDDGLLSEETSLAKCIYPGSF